jgi:hypothetical protein
MRQERASLNVMRHGVAPTAADRYSRRAVLAGLGLGLGMLPVLEARGAGVVRRAPPDRRCLILATFTNGVIQDEFFPRGDGEDLTALTLPAITAPLEPHKRDLVFMRGLELRHFTDHPGHGGGHENYCTVFTGRPGIPKDTGDPRFIPVVAGGITLDRYIADALARRRRFVAPALHLGVQIEKQGGGEMQGRVSFRDFGQPNSPEDDPHAVFAALFAGGRGRDPELARLRAERRSLLDYVGAELTRFSRRLGAEDRTKVDAHLHAVRDIERQLEAPAHRPGRCALPPVPRLDHKDGERYPEVANVQMDLAVAALACDLTRVITLQLNNGNGVGVVFSWLGIEGKGQEFPVRDHHDVAHRPGEGNKDKIAVDRWYMQRCADMIAKLAAVREGAGRLLDRTALLWTNHMGNGGGHTSTDLPWVLAGGCGGAFKTGRCLRLPARTPVNGVFVSLANAMGVPTETFGDPRYGGALRALGG